MSKKIYVNSETSIQIKKKIFEIMFATINNSLKYTYF